MTDEPKLINSVHDLAWFEEVLAESRKTLEALPPGAQPSWYREYMAKRQLSASTNPKEPE